MLCPQVLSRAQKQWPCNGIHSERYGTNHSREGLPQVRLQRDSDHVSEHQGLKRPSQLRIRAGPGSRMATERREGRLPKVGIPTSVTVRTDEGLGLHLTGRVLACCCGLNVNCPPLSTHIVALEEVGHWGWTLRFYNMAPF